MAVRLFFCLLGLAAAVLGGMMLLQPGRFERLEAWWAEKFRAQKKWYHSITKGGGALLLLVGTVLFLVMLVSLSLSILY